MKSKVTKRKSALCPRYFTLQWHLTERCNWYCKHCYREEKYIKEELPLNILIKIFKQYIRLIREFDTLGPKRTRLILAGGEPLLRKDIFLFLEKIYKYNKYYSLVILSNGSLITEGSAIKLKSLGVEMVQLSLEGMENNNDTIRGRGTFQKVMRAVQILIKAKINVVLCLTLTKQSISDVPSLIKLCDKLGISQLGIRRLVLIGQGEELKKWLLEPLELKKTYLYLERKRKELLGSNNNNLKFLLGGCDESIFAQELKRPLINCGVTEGRILAILPNGDVIPCRRLPIRIGNVLKRSLIDIYYNSDKLEQLRNLNNASHYCKECLYFDACLSGAKCISYAYFNKMSAPDPQCWRLFKKLPDLGLFKDEKDKVSKMHRFHFTLMPWLFKYGD